MPPQPRDVHGGGRQLDGFRAQNIASFRDHPEYGTLAERSAEELDSSSTTPRRHRVSFCDAHDYTDVYAAGNRLPVSDLHRLAYQLDRAASVVSPNVREGLM